MLSAWLDFHHATLALKREGLTPDQLREQSCPPSPMSLLGLIRQPGGGGAALVPPVPERRDSGAGRPVLV
nr:DUF664 domain-containing protein [Kitasatospora griseola]